MDVSMATGLRSALAVLPAGVLISLLFRLRQSHKRKTSPRRLFKDCSVSDISTVEAYQDAFHEGLYQSLAQEAWGDRYEHNTGWLGDAAASVEPHKRALGTPDSIAISFDGSKMPNENFKDFSRQNLQSSPSYPSGRGCCCEQPLLAWCHYLTWSVCLCLCVTSAVLTGILGLKFSPMKSLLWTYSLLFSLLTGAFVIYPALIFVVAVVVSLRWRNRSDFFDVSSQTKSIVEAHKYWTGSGRSSVLSLHNRSVTRSSYFDMVVRARQRVRYLRLVRPPTPDQLRHTLKRLRKSTLIRRFLSELSLYVIMLVLLLFVAHGKSCNNKHRLTQAIKTQLRRGPYKHFQSIRTQQDWWNWTSGVMLPELYKDPRSNSSSRENRWQTVLEANILIGELILKKMDTVRNSRCQEMYSKLGEFVLTSNSPNVFGKTGCNGSTQRAVSLGQTRSAAHATLTRLKASDWLGGRTCAVAAQFVLYHPPSGLFSTVTLLAERGLAGVLQPRAGVRSTRLLLDTGALDCASVTAELLFFFIVMAQMIFQIWIICQNGLLPYCLDLRNWLEGGIILMSILYYICFAYHFTLKSEKIDQMLREDFKVFMDLENVTFWEELSVSLHGVLSFLFSFKSLFILGMNETMCLPLRALRTVLSNLTWPMAFNCYAMWQRILFQTAGAILTMALSSMGCLLHRSSHAYSTLLRSARTVLAYGIGPRGFNKWFELKCSSCIYSLLFLGSLICVIKLAWTAVLKGMVTSLVKMKQRTIKKKQFLTMPELGHYIQNKLFTLVGKSRTNWTEDHHFGSNANSFCLEEFEDLVDELLFKLSAFSNSLHHTLPSKDPVSQSPMSMLSGQSSSFESEVKASLQDHPLTEDFMMPPIEQSDKYESGQKIAFTGDVYNRWTDIAK